MKTNKTDGINSKKLKFILAFKMNQYQIGIICQL